MLNINTLTLQCFALFAFALASEEHNFIIYDDAKEPLLLTKSLGSYHYPKNAYIDKYQDIHYYYSSKDDGTYFCPADDEKQFTTQDQLQKKSQQSEYQFCLYKKKFKKKSNMQCASEVQPIIVKVMDNDNTHKACGKKLMREDSNGELLNGKLYQFVYMVCHLATTFTSLFNVLTRKKAPEVEGFSSVQYPRIYEICIHTRTNETIYSKHKLMYPSLLKNINPLMESLYREISVANYDIPELDNLIKVFNTHRTVESDQRLPMTVQKLVPTEDLALRHWKYTTFHQVNVKLLWVPLVQLWEWVNHHIRQKLIETFQDTGKQYTIYTGTLDLHNVDDRDSTSISAPSLWWKVIYSDLNREGVAVIMHSIPHFRPTKTDRSCVTSVCNVETWRPAIHEILAQHVYCCDLHDVRVLQDFNLDFKPEDVETILELD